MYLNNQTGFWTWLKQDTPITKHLLIPALLLPFLLLFRLLNPYLLTPSLSQVWQGQVWRLFTPFFLTMPSISWIVMLLNFYQSSTSLERDSFGRQPQQQADFVYLFILFFTYCHVRSFIISFYLIIVALA
jgi:Der1-like family